MASLILIGHKTFKKSWTPNRAMIVVVVDCVGVRVARLHTHLFFFKILQFENKRFDPGHCDIRGVDIHIFALMFCSEICPN